MSIAVRNDKNLVTEHFDRLSSAGDWSRLYAVTNGFTYQFHIRRMRVLELLPDHLGRVVDIGCGPGVMVEQVLRRGGTFEGVDLSLEMVQEATRMFGHLDHVSFKRGNIEALDLPSMAYDQVICMAVLEYLKTPDRALAEIARILRPGGQVVITVPKRIHIDQFTVTATMPLRALGRVLKLGKADRMARLCLQPTELDAAARQAGLLPDGRSQYYFTLLPYPLTRMAPAFCMRFNIRLEAWHRTQAALPSFFAHGYVGRYRKEQGLVG